MRLLARAPSCRQYGIRQHQHQLAGIMTNIIYVIDKTAVCAHVECTGLDWTGMPSPPPDSKNVRARARWKYDARCAVTVREYVVVRLIFLWSCVAPLFTFTFYHYTGMHTYARSARARA